MIRSISLGMTRSRRHTRMRYYRAEEDITAQVAAVLGLRRSRGEVLVPRDMDVARRLTPLLGVAVKITPL